MVKSHIAVLEAHHEWSQLQYLGLVDKILEACQSGDSRPPEDMESRLFRVNNYYRLPEILKNLSQDLKPFYAAVVDGNPGFVSDMVK